MLVPWKGKVAVAQFRGSQVNPELRLLCREICMPILCLRRFSQGSFFQKHAALAAVQIGDWKLFLCLQMCVHGGLWWTGVPFIYIYIYISVIWQTILSKVSCSWAEQMKVKSLAQGSNRGSLVVAIFKFTTFQSWDRLQIHRDPDLDKGLMGKWMLCFQQLVYH